jgi:uncharacterized protein (DUF433 family)
MGLYASITPSVRIEITMYNRRKIPCYNVHMVKQIDAPALVREQLGDEIYDYYPLGSHVVVAPGVCGGRPTFKYTRLEVAVVLAMIASGMSSHEVMAEYEQSRLSQEAIQEALHLANQALLESTQAYLPLAA